VEAVVAGRSISACVLQSGVVMAWGQEDLVGGACGFHGARHSHATGPATTIERATNSNASLERHLPRPLHGLVRFGRVRIVACGARFVVAVMAASGRVVSWGENRVGQLGRPICPCAPPRALHGPEVVDFADGGVVVEISCGFEFTAVVTDRGSVLTWGCNRCGQLGRSKVAEGFSSSPSGFCATPAPVDAPCQDHFGRVGAVVCGDHHLVAIAAGRVFTCGAAEFGRLGLGCGSENAYVLNYVPIAGQAQRIFAGSACTFVLTIQDATCSDDGDEAAKGSMLWAFGYNGAGNLGLGDIKNRSEPQLVPLPSASLLEDLAVGEEHVVCVLSFHGARRVCAWGSSSEGRLGPLHNPEARCGTMDFIPSPILIGALMEDLEEPPCRSIEVSSSGSHSLALARRE
jgi:hypothetical protein